MNKFIIIPNVKKDVGLENTKTIIKWLEKYNCQIYLTDRIARQLDKKQYTINKDEYNNVDCAVVLGGDGTIINTARNLAQYDLPILGINFGHLGFLAEVEKKEALATLKNITEGDYYIQKRMMLDTELILDSKKEFKGIALNDVVVTRTAISRMMKFSIYVNDGHVNDYSADGLIISTPTGSTAYNLSAGGPILDPKNEMMVITPICSHSLTSRSIVLSKNDVVTISFEENRKNWVDDMILTIDGQECHKISNNHKIVIYNSRYNTKLITCKKNSFYDILRKKLGR